MITFPVIDGVVQGAVPADAVYTVLTPTLLTVYQRGDDIPKIITTPDADADLRAQFKAEQAAQEQADFAAYKDRSGAPSYKAATFKIAAEKLGLLDAIDAAIMALVEKQSDKALYVWWVETPTISRGDAEWQQIEPAVDWGKASADDIFALAAQI